MQFRILYRDFLSRMVDLEVLSARGDPQKLLAQFGALLGGLSFVLALMMVQRFTESKLPPEKLAIAAWGDEEFLIGITIAVVGLFAVIAWNNVLPDRRDVLVLGPLPVRLRTIFLAKVAAIAAGLGISVGAMNAFTGLSLGFTAIPPGAGALGLPRTFFAYWLTMIAAGIFVFATLLAVQGIAAQLLSYPLFLRVSSLLQLAAFFAILTIFFLTPPLATVPALSAPENQRLLDFLPSYWFLGLFHRLNGSMHPVFAPLAARALRNSTIVLSIAAITYVSAYYRHVRRIVEQPDIAPGSRSSLRFASRIARFALARPLDRAIVMFTARTVARSRHHRFLLAAYGGVGLAIALAYAKSLIYGYSHEPWDQLNSAFLVGGFVVLLFAIVGARAIFALPVALPANWVFKITAVHSPFAYFQTVRRSLYALTAIPIWILAAIFYLAVWPGRPAIEHVIVLIAAGVFMIERSLDHFRKIPFACSYLPGSGNLTVRLGIYAIVFLLIAEVIFGQAEFNLLHQVSGFAIFAVILISAAAWRRWRTTQTAAAFVELQFEEFPPAELFALDLSSDPQNAFSQSYISALDPEPRFTRLRLIAASIALLLLAGFCYEQFGEWRDHRRAPRIGRAFDIGGRKLNIYCSGEGSPAVIFDSGQSMPGFDWSLVQPEIAEFTRACWYDPAGLGWSDSGPSEASDAAARDLHALLAAAEVRAPYLLVGHSLGGYDVRVYRSLYPAEVSGMVLVDAAHEDFSSRAALPQSLHRITAGALEIAARFGLLRLIAPTPDPTPGRFTTHQWDQIWTLRWQPKSVLAAAKEPVEESAAQARAAGNFGDLPLIVLTAGAPAVDEDVWNELQAELAWRSTRGRQVIVPNTGHMIPEQAPEAVAGAVYEIYSEIKTRIK